jgi:hypothetical protein
MRSSPTSTTRKPWLGGDPRDCRRPPRPVPLAGTFFVRLNSLLPNLVDRGLRKQLPLIRRLSQKTDKENLKP